MNKATFSMMVLLASSAAQAANFEKVVLDPSRSTEESVLLQCDDSFQDGADLFIPGRPGRDFSVSVDADVTHGQRCVVAGPKKGAEGEAIYRVRADEGCTVKVRFHKDAGHDRTQTVINFGSC